MMNFSIPQAKPILTLAWPLILANSFWNLQLVIDRVILGHYSTEALGAAMAVMGVFWIPMALLQQTVAYVTTFVAQYHGAQQRESIGIYFYQSLYLSIIGGILFLLLNTISEELFWLLGHSSVMHQLEVKYFNALSYSALPTAVVAAVSGFYTGLGRTSMVLKINFIGLVGNACLDYLLIFGLWGAPELGIAGAGYATAMATYLAAGYGIYQLFREKQNRVYFTANCWHLHLQSVQQFLFYGIPSGLQWAFEGLAFTVFLSFMGQLPNGEVALASSSIAVTVMMLSVLPAMGVAQAILTLVGQKLGEKKPELAQVITWSGVKISLLYMIPLSMTFWFFPEFYTIWFEHAPVDGMSSSSTIWSEVMSLTPRLLAIVAIFTIIDSAYLNISFALKGAGDTRFVSALALSIPWPLMVFPAYLLRGHDQAVTWSWAFVIVYSLIITSLLCWRFYRGKWKTLSIIG